MGELEKLYGLEPPASTEWGLDFYPDQPYRRSRFQQTIQRSLLVCYLRDLLSKKLFDRGIEHLQTLLKELYQENEDLKNQAAEKVRDLQLETVRLRKLLEKEQEEREKEQEERKKDHQIKSKALCEMRQKLNEAQRECEQYEQALGSRLSRTPWSEGDREIWYHDLVSPSSEDLFSAMECREKLRGALKTLTPREQKVLEHLYFGDATHVEVGEAFEVSGNRIAQLESKALRKLRHPSSSWRTRVFVKDPPGTIPPMGHLPPLPDPMADVRRRKRNEVPVRAKNKPTHKQRRK